MYSQRLDASVGTEQGDWVRKCRSAGNGGGEGEKWADSEGIWEMKYAGLRGREKESGMTPRSGSSNQDSDMEDDRVGGEPAFGLVHFEFDLPVIMQVSC